MTTLAIDAQHLSRRFGRRWALADVSFQVSQGSVLMVAGRNGSGKSTLLRVLSTVLKADRGGATILGFDIRSHRQDVRSLSALLSHYSYLYESLTAGENLTVAANALGRRDAPIDALLERVSLLERKNDFVSTFSAGMRKRLSFARALLQEPKLVLLDEPYGQLDPPGFALVDDVVHELKARGTTVIIATHQVERVQRLADSTLTLEEGRVQK